MHPPLRLLISGLLLFTFSSSFAQEKGKSGFLQTLEHQARMYADFLNVYAATYAGEHNTQLESIRNQAMNQGEEGLESKGFTADMSEIKELLTAFYPGSTLETSLLEFQNATGLKVYLTGKIGGYGSNRIAGMFNELSYRKHPEQKVPPFLEVFATQQRDTTDGHYTLSVEVVPSGGVEVENAAEHFNKHFEERKYDNRSDARKHLKGVLLVGFADLKEKIGPAYVPPLSIKHGGVRYRDGDKIEIAQDIDGRILLSAVDKEDQAPDKKVNWTVFPHQGLPASDHQIRLKTDEAGSWEITAESGDHQLTVTVEVISVPLDFDEALKAIVREVLRQARQSAERAIARAEADGDSLQSLIDTKSAELHGEPQIDIPAGQGSGVIAAEVTTEYELPQGWDEKARLQELQNDSQTKAYLNLHRHRLLNTANYLMQLKVEEFIMALLNDNESFGVFITSLKEDMAGELGSFIGKSITGNQKESIRQTVMNYVNYRIEEAAHENE